MTDGRACRGGLWFPGVCTGEHPGTRPLSKTALEEEEYVHMSVEYFVFLNAYI